MKKLVIIAMLCGSQIGFAEKLTTLDGTVYENVKIVSADPERMLIVHDGGGCQVKYADLADGLSEQQRKAVEEGLTVYAERQVRREQLQQEAAVTRLAQETFAQAQRDKGLVLFEGDWMKPADRQEVLARRELDKLEQQRLAVELEKQKAELRKAQWLAEQERQRFEEQRESQRVIYSYYSYPSSRTVGPGCGSSRYYGYVPHNDNGLHGHASYRYPSGFGVSFSTGGSSVSYRSGSPSSGHGNNRNRAND